MDLPAHGAPLTTFHKWLAERPEEERQRPLSAGGRAHGGLIRWPLDGLTSPGVICYERAIGRLHAEKATLAPNEDAMRLILHMEILPTAVANAADHYLLVGPMGEARYWTVEEVARSFGIAARSRLLSALVNPDAMTAVQAVECLGRGAHVGVVRRIIRSLVARGLLAKGASYGSAFSGLDCVAAAMDDELDGDWSYRFASERLPYARRGLLHAWGERGLKAERCYVEATSGPAVAEEKVDLWAITPSCEAFSKRNRGRSPDGQRAALSEIWKGLGYARTASPRLILVENLAVPEVSEPLTGLLLRMEGYRVETATLDPRRLLGEPVARERRFWILRREA
mmetsp:Transcript_18317/g.27531  ORF Transcript_18317/g.27531 Transcript_18317/m.27531 type:complete len:340 (-) Transcript_18317:118-1137(-)